MASGGAPLGKGYDIPGSLRLRLRLARFWRRAAKISGVAKLRKGSANEPDFDLCNSIRGERRVSFLPNGLSLAFPSRLRENPVLVPICFFAGLVVHAIRIGMNKADVLLTRLWQTRRKHSTEEPPHAIALARLSAHSAHSASVAKPILQ